jgi:hypothetical protein
MIDRTRVTSLEGDNFTRDERSMRVMEYAMAIMAFAAALPLSFH